MRLPVLLIGLLLASPLVAAERAVVPGTGSLATAIAGAAPGDVLVAVSFEPYAQETLELAQEAVARGARLLAITDSQLSPLATLASTTLIAQDGATFGFRSLTSTLSLAQSLFLGLAYRMELAYEPSRKP